MSRGKNGWISTFTGRAVSPLWATPDDICTEDIAHALSYMPRFTGHTRKFYSVGEHTLRVTQQVERHCRERADLTPREKACNVLWAAVHDASEAYLLMDIARPVKRQPEMDAYRGAERRLMDVIADHYGLPREMPAVVKHFDELILSTECRDLMNGFSEEWDHWNRPKLDEVIVPYSSDFTLVEAKLLGLIQATHARYSTRLPADV